ncbi:MAG: hypothetical protein ACFB16_02830 [Phormidesmis sp.]
MTISSQAKQHPLCDRLKILQIGDYWEYSVEGTLERDGQPLPLTGSSTVTVEQRTTEQGTFKALVFSRLLKLSGVEGPEGNLSPPLGLFYFSQNDETLDMFIMGDTMGLGGSDRFAAEPQLFFPGYWTPQTRYENTLDFGNSDDVTNTLEVTGTVDVATPLGNYHAWIAPITSHSKPLGTLTGCDYWTPQLGAPIQFEMFMPTPDGSTMQTRSTMRAYQLQD